MIPGDILKKVSGRDGRVKSSGCKMRPVPRGLQGAQILKYGEAGEGDERWFFPAALSFSQ